MSPGSPGPAPTRNTVTERPLPPRLGAEAVSRGRYPSQSAPGGGASASRELEVVEEGAAAGGVEQMVRRAGTELGGVVALVGVPQKDAAIEAGQHGPQDERAVALLDGVRADRQVAAPPDGGQVRPLGVDRPKRRPVLD